MSFQRIQVLICNFNNLYHPTENGGSQWGETSCQASGNSVAESLQLVAATKISFSNRCSIFSGLDPLKLGSSFEDDIP